MQQRASVRSGCGSPVSGRTLWCFHARTWSELAVNGGKVPGHELPVDLLAPAVLVALRSSQKAQADSGSGRKRQLSLAFVNLCQGRAQSPYR
jgi:hypothetical protein